MPRDLSDTTLDELNRMASIGQLAGPLSHEFNNFLNLLLLNLAVLEKQLPERLRAELADIRRQGSQAAALIKQFQQLRKRKAAGFPPLELDRLIRETVLSLLKETGELNMPPFQLASPGQEAGGREPVLHLELDEKLPEVAASPVELEHLLSFLIRNAAAAAGRGGRVTVRAAPGEKGVTLAVEDTGPGVPAEVMPNLFEPTTRARPGTQSLELAACRSIARRLGGSIEAVNLPQRGIVISVELPLRAEP